MRLIFYLDILSMWCALADEAYERVRQRYDGELSCEWRLATINRGRPMGYTLAQETWYYERCAFVTGTQFNPNWNDGAETGSWTANAAAEAARLLGRTDDGVRRALADAACREGRKLGRRDVAIDVAAKAGGLDPTLLERMMNDPRVAERLGAAADELAALGVDQRPTFLLENATGDRAVLSGIYRHEPLEACIDAMLHDEHHYATFAEMHPGATA